MTTKVACFFNIITNPDDDDDDDDILYQIEGFTEPTGFGFETDGFPEKELALREIERIFVKKDWRCEDDDMMEFEFEISEKYIFAITLSTTCNA
jgi:hypothetical protein